MTRGRRGHLFVALFAALVSTARAADPAPLPHVGVNLAGAEFGPCAPGKPGVYGKDYVYPSNENADYFLDAGMTTIRLPFKWERLRPTIDGPFDHAELKRLKAVVTHITRRGGTVILDPHNYARYFGQPIGAAAVPAAAFADLWKTLADTFKADDRVWFGLMNEPHDMPDADWLAAANAAIAAIRKTGAKNFLLVPGNNWTGAHSWTTSGNATRMLEIRDPLDRYAFDVHQYFDGNSSGGDEKIVSQTIGRERLEKFTAWCRTHKKKAFLGEFAAAASDDGKAVVTDTLAFMEANADVWLGWTWWAAGPWWGDYMFTLEPKDKKPAPQSVWLASHLPKKK